MKFNINKGLLGSVTAHALLLVGVVASANLVNASEITPLGEKAITITFQQPEPENLREAKPVIKKTIQKPVLVGQSRTQVVKPEVAESAPEQVLQIASFEPAAPASNNSSAGDGKSDNFKAKIHSWLEQHKHYPRAAKVSRIEGRAILFFKVDDKGNVLEYRITQSAGNETLDNAVVEMIEAANPVPAPADYALGQMDFSVPVSFKLN